MKNQKKLFPDVDGPKYGIPFSVIGFQAQVEGKYTELIETESKQMITLRTRRDYLKWKEDLSKRLCDSFNTMLKTKFDKIVSFKVKYLLHNEDHYI